MVAEWGKALSPRAKQLMVLSENLASKKLVIGCNCPLCRACVKGAISLSLPVCQAMGNNKIKSKVT